MEYKLESIAFPLIASGAFGYPKDKALKTAISVIGDFLFEHEMTVFLVVYDKAAFKLSEKLFASITEYIDDHYIDEQPFNRRERSLRSQLIYEESSKDMLCYSEECYSSEVPATLKKHKRSLDDVVKHLEETFSQSLLRLIDEKNMTDSETYKKANIDRKLFSKIRNDIYYKPSKPTAIAFAIALGLNMDETKDLLLKAGFALSNSSMFDVIIQFFIEDNNYDIFEINQVLFEFDQNLLGV